MNTPRHEVMDTNDAAIEDGINNAMETLDQEDMENKQNDESKNGEVEEGAKPVDAETGGEAKNDESKDEEVQEVEQNENGEWQKVSMEYAVKRPQMHLWKHIKDLQNEISCKSFYDLEIYCQDGVVSWNRLLMALSHPQFHFLIFDQLHDEVNILSLIFCTALHHCHNLQQSVFKIPAITTTVCQFKSGPTNI